MDMSNLKDADIYSIILFALYKLKNLPEYSTLSEMIYLLDRKSFLKLCEYFGGMTIKIPTIEELEMLIHALCLYQKVEVEHESLSDCLNELELKSYKTKQIRKLYTELCEVLKNYEFH